MVNHQPGNFGGHSNCGSVCQVILKEHLIKGPYDSMINAFSLSRNDHVIKGSCDFMGGNPFMVSHRPAKFGDHEHHGSRYITFLVVEE